MGEIVFKKTIFPGVGIQSLYFFPSFCLSTKFFLSIYSMPSARLGAGNPKAKRELEDARSL